MSKLEYDSKQDHFVSRTTSEFNGENKWRNEYIWNLGFENFHTINWSFFFGKYGMIWENDDLGFLLDKVIFD